MARGHAAGCHVSRAEARALRACEVRRRSSSYRRGGLAMRQPRPAGAHLWSICVSEPRGVGGAARPDEPSKPQVVIRPAKTGAARDYALTSRAANPGACGAIVALRVSMSVPRTACSARARYRRYRSGSRRRAWRRPVYLTRDEAEALTYLASELGKKPPPSGGGEVGAVAKPGALRRRGGAEMRVTCRKDRGARSGLPTILDGALSPTITTIPTMTMTWFGPLFRRYRPRRLVRSPIGATPNFTNRSQP